MENSIISWLFETDAVRVCPADRPFWYTSGKLGPFYINTQFLYGSEADANALLSVIEGACAGDRMKFYDTVWTEIDKQLKSCRIYSELIDQLCDAARTMGADFVSGGERRDYFFSMPVAKRLGLGHLSIFKDLTSVYTTPEGKTVPSAEAGLAGKKCVHIADLITVASSYIRAWIPAVEGLGAKITWSLAVVDRDQGGAKILADAGCPLTSLVVVKPDLFEEAVQLGRITRAQQELVNSFIADPDKFMEDFLLSHPDFLANELAAGGKNAGRAQLCIDSGFAPKAALPKA